MPGGPIAILTGLLLMGTTLASAQETHDFGLPPQSGSQYPVLPPPSGSQYPVLPPETGQRYAPGVGGRFGPSHPRSAVPRQIVPGGGEIGVAGSLSPETPKAPGEEVDRLADIAPALRRCWTPPPLDGPDTGVMATVRFSLRRDGSLFGQPRITWGTRRTDPVLREQFRESILAAIQACTPLRLSRSLGASIAGRPFSIRFHGRAPSNERQT
jgi:hypothetical protein